MVLKITIANVDNFRAIFAKKIVKFFLRNTVLSTYLEILYTTILDYSKSSFVGNLKYFCNFFRSKVLAHLTHPPLISKVSFCQAFFRVLFVSLVLLHEA